MENNKPEINEIASDLEEQIFNKSEELFMSIGIRNTTMDDLARELGISKKTLYKAIENKSDLVTKCIRHDIDVRQKEIIAILEKYSNPIEQLLHIGALIFKSISRYKITIVHDLMKFYPESWQYITEHKDNFIKTIISDNLTNGIKLGIYRKNIDIKLYAVFYANGVDISLNSNFFRDESFIFSEVFREFLLFYLRAITNAESHKQLEQYIKEVNF